MNLTPFGLCLRKLRLERLIRLKDMADGIEVSSAFLSAVETGKKEIPDTLIDNIINQFNLSAGQMEELYRAADETRKSITIAMPEKNEARYLVGAFARNLNKLDDERQERILKLLRGDNDEHIL